jgi:uncharacterized protein (TIGR02284 family)
MQTMMPHGPLATPRDQIAETDEAQPLIAVYNRTVDSVKGYTKMVEKAEPSFRDTAERFRALHARHAGDLERILADLGIKAKADGSMMGTINQAVVTFRAFFDHIDEDVMDQVGSGEDWVLKAFDEAIVARGGAIPTVKPREMQAELTELLAETRHLG